MAVIMLVMAVIMPVMAVIMLVMAVIMPVMAVIMPVMAVIMLVIMVTLLVVVVVNFVLPRQLLLLLLRLLLLQPTLADLVVPTLVATVVFHALSVVSLVQGATAADVVLRAHARVGVAPAGAELPARGAGLQPAGAVEEDGRDTHRRELVLACLNSNGLMPIIFDAMA